MSPATVNALWDMASALSLYFGWFSIGYLTVWVSVWDDKTRPTAEDLNACLLVSAVAGPILVIVVIFVASKIRLDGGHMLKFEPLYGSRLYERQKRAEMLRVRDEQEARYRRQYGPVDYKTMDEGGVI